MPTDKRARQKQGRDARRQAEAEAWAKTRRNQTVLRVLVVVFVVGAAATVMSRLGAGSSESAATTSTADDPVTTPPTVAAKSVAGKPCVKRKGDLPEGAPDVPVQVGKPPTKLIVEDLKVGTGAKVVEADTVKVHYIGVSCSSGTIFDSSWSRGEPVGFPLSDVIDGWTQGIPGMQVGGQRLLGIPSDLAYGDDPSRAPDIQPDESLWFVVDLVRIGDDPPADATTTTLAGDPAAGTTESTTATTEAP